MRGKSEAWLNQLGSQQSGVGIAVQAPEQNQRHSGVGERLQIPPRDTEVGWFCCFSWHKKSNSWPRSCKCSTTELGF